MGARPRFELGFSGRVLAAKPDRHAGQRRRRRPAKLVDGLRRDVDNGAGISEDLDLGCENHSGPQDRRRGRAWGRGRRMVVKNADFTTNAFAATTQGSARLRAIWLGSVRRRPGYALNGEDREFADVVVPIGARPRTRTRLGRVRRRRSSESSWPCRPGSATRY